MALRIANGGKEVDDANIGGKGSGVLGAKQER
jgi:hypothetical protein